MENMAMPSPRRRSAKQDSGHLTEAFRGELLPAGAELTKREGRSFQPASVLVAKIEAQQKDVKPKQKQRGSRAHNRNE